MFEHRHCCFFFFIFHSLLSPSKPNTHRHPFSSLTHHNPPSPPSPHLVSEFSRILSDHRNPHHDLELSLNALSTQISTDLVEQVLKRCKNLGLSAQRFILWAKTILGFRHSAESYHILIDILGSSKQYAVLWDFLIEVREFKCCDIGPEIFWLIFQLNCSSNSRGFTLFAWYSQAQDLYSSGLQDWFEDLPKLVEDILQTSVSTGPRGAFRMVQGIQAFIGVGGEWLADVSKDLDTEVVIATAREPSTNATAVTANLVVDERQMNALFLDVVRC
ncbi:hypothetical protein TB1_029659 [Malus domestica]